VTTPFDDNSATAGNGVMIALKVGSQEQVRAFHAKAVELGGHNEGDPGPRGDHGFYGGRAVIMGSMAATSETWMATK
jgi:predicted lactoylglutathione lyase